MLLAVMPACSLYLMASKEDTEPLPWTPRLLILALKKKKDKPFKIMVPQGTIANSQEYCRIFGYFNFLKEVQLYWVSIYWIPYKTTTWDSSQLQQETTLHVFHWSRAVKKIRHTKGESLESSDKRFFCCILWKIVFINSTNQY